MSEPVTVGDLVTPENVASLPVGAIVRWTWADPAGKPAAGVKVAPNAWEMTGCDGREDSVDDACCADDAAPAFIAYLPERA